MIQLFVNESNHNYSRYALVENETIIIGGNLAFVLGNKRYVSLSVFKEHPALDKLLVQAETKEELIKILREKYIEEFI